MSFVVAEGRVHRRQGSGADRAAGTWRAQRNPQVEELPLTCGLMMVGDTGFEPVTSSVSRKRATTAPIARGGDGI
jgi:hypothetical protein